MVNGTQSPYFIVWKSVIVSDPHCHGLPPRALHPRLGPRTPRSPTQGPGFLRLRTPTWDLVPSLGAQDPPLGPLLGSQELYLGPGNLTQGLGPPFRAQDPYSGCKTNTHSAAPRHRAHDLFGSQVPNSRLGTFVLSELKAYIGSLGAIASSSNTTKQ